MSTFVLCVGCGTPLYGFSPCQWCTCERCGNDLRDGFCALCNSRNSCVYDPNLNSFDYPPDSYHPPHPTCETYSGDSCGNDSQFGYDCSPQFPPNYEPELGYIQNYNFYPHDSPSFPQQDLCCDNRGGLHETFQFVFENSNADIESFSPSPIPVEDSNSRMKEIDLSFNPDYPMPPCIEEDDDHFERDVLILEELPSNYSHSLPVNESFYFDIPSFSRPLAKPPDGNTGILNIKMMGDNSEQNVPIPKLTITLVSNQEKSPDLLSHWGIENFQLSAKRPMMIHGKNISILDVPLFHFYPLDHFKYGGNWVKLRDLKQALSGRHPMLI
nr:pre-mRNA splicing Prp18-interacting factor [Tanacetum cinerariifolium]